MFPKSCTNKAHYYRSIRASKRKYYESKTTYSLYNGALDPNEDPADYHAPTKAVYVS